jgi:cytochrome d ubiquinol oxidase subunit II
VPLLTAILGYAFWRALRRGRELAPFLLTLGLFALTFAGLAISMFPYIVPRALDIHAAAAPDASLRLMLVGAVVLIPAILAYTGWAYLVFRGKVGHAGYH